MMAKPALTSPETSPKQNRLVAGLVCLLPAAFVILTLDAPGLTWDEAVYLGSASRCALWLDTTAPKDWHDFACEAASPGFRAQYAATPRPWTRFSEPVLDFIWWQGDHPPLAKLAMAFTLRWFMAGGVLWALRLAAPLAFGALLFLVYLFAEEHLGKHAGLFAVLSLALMPRVFAHAHFAALDVPMALAWFATTFAFTKGIESRRWAAATGVLFGLALLTKINAVLIPFALVPWGIGYHRRKALPNLIAMAVIAPIVFYAGWPALWAHPVGKTAAFLRTALQRAHIPVYYLGTQYSDASPPWHYPIVLTLCTLPIGTVLFAAAGAAGRLRRLRKDPTLGLILLSVLVILGSACLPTAPKYDGVRLFLPVFPFVALLASAGLRRAWEKISARRFRLAIALAMAYFGVQAGSLCWIHPFGLSYYSIACGGVPGAARLGMETTYWGEVIDADLLGRLRGLPDGSPVEFRHVGTRVIAAHQHALGDFPENVRESSNGDPSRYVVLVMRQGMFTTEDWDVLREHTPLWTASFQGVPLCSVYRIESVK